MASTSSSSDRVLAIWYMGCRYDRISIKLTIPDCTSTSSSPHRVLSIWYMGCRNDRIKTTFMTRQPQSRKLSTAHAVMQTMPMVCFLDSKLFCCAVRGISSNKFTLPLESISKQRNRCRTSHEAHHVWHCLLHDQH